MTIVNEEVIKDLELAREVLSKTDYSIVIISNGKIWKQKKGDGIRPILEAMEEMGDDIHNSIIGNRILGRASALLCRYAKAQAVYSPQGTKTGIALLIMGGIPCQVDEMIPQNVITGTENNLPFEKLLKDVTSPEEAYNVLKEKVLK